MKKLKKMISIALIFVMFFTGIPFQDFSFGGIPYAYAEEIAPTVDISYDDFTETKNLQLNGDSLIKNNAIRFENSGNMGKSVFTKDKLALGENLSFSAAFSFKNISPPTPTEGTEGGFTFTLQPLGNSTTVNDFHDASINPSLSIAFTADYRNSGIVTFKFEPDPIISCGLSVAPYIDGYYNNPINVWNIHTYNTGYESSDFYNVWLGYDGEEGVLNIFCRDPYGNYTNYRSDYFNLSHTMRTNEVYAGFMGSLGNAGNISEISNWYFKNDLSILNEAIVEADEAMLIIDMEMVETDPVENLFLSFFGQYGSTISWISSNTDVVSEDGTINPPLVGEENQTVILSANIKKGSVERKTRNFTVTIKAADSDIAEADYNALTETIVLGDNDALDNVVLDLNLLNLGEHGSTISWASTDADVINQDGTVTRPAYIEGDKVVTLTASINMNWEIREKSFHITVKALGLSDAEIVNADQLWLTDTIILNGNSSFNKITKNLKLPIQGKYESVIQWRTSNEGVVALDGAVIIPVLGQNNQTVTLTAIISKGEAVREKEFTVIVKVSDDDIISADAEWLTDTLILNDNKVLTEVITNLNLPSFGYYGSTIVWNSTKLTVISANGTVTRPLQGWGNEEITLWAIIRSGDSGPLTRSITVTVKAIGSSDQEMASADKLWLTDEIIKNLNSSLNSVTSNLSLPIIGGSHGSLISWESTDTSVVDTSGIVTRPEFFQGDKTVNLTATINIGTSAPETKIFIVTVKAIERTDEEIVNADYEWLEAAVILNENSNLDDVTKDLILPIEGQEGSEISWTTTDTLVVDIKGTVKRPTYTQGSKVVTLTANIRIGSTVKEKTFSITVIANSITDEELVQMDFVSLTDTLILNENNALNNVTKKLNLPTNGEKGSEISWISSDTTVVDINGTVKRPTYTQGSKVVTLTATVRIGSTVKEKAFSITVIANFITDEELVQMDYDWLTDNIILNGNSSLDNVITNLYFPTSGKYGIGASRISWASSSHGFVTIGGNVYRPMFHLGDQSVTLTATISKGTVFLKKTFTVIVKYRDSTDTEAVNEDVKWLKKYNILGENFSASSVTKNLDYPLSAPYDATITWHSDNIDIISNDGEVTRPENKRGNRRVNVTATVSKGDVQVVVVFQYIVLEKPDISAPVVIAATPGNNSTAVLWDTDKITITYNENIILDQNSDITLSASKFVQLSSYAEKDKLIIKTLSELSSGENILLIPKGSVRDVAGNTSDAYELKFTVEEKLIKNIELISSSPYNTEKDVDVNLSEISLQFDCADIVKGRYFDLQFTLGTVGKDFYESKFVSLPGKLSRDKITIKLKEPLESATVYEIRIIKDVVQDRFLNNNSTEVIQFRTKGTLIPEVQTPIIESIYPADGQTDVSVNPNIEVSFTDIQKFKNELKLTDEFGTEYPLYAPYTLNFFNVKTKLIFKPRSRLKPNTVYTLSGPYGRSDDPDSKKFSTQFTTGSGLLITKTSPTTGDLNASTRGVVEIYFDTSISKGDNFKNIVFQDYFGFPVQFEGEEIGNKAVLRSVTELDIHIPYTVYIPYGAYENSIGKPNDQNKITFSISREKLPDNLELSHLNISDIGFVGKGFKISIDENEMTSWVNYARSIGYGPISYKWYIDGNLVSTSGIFYKTFSEQGEHTIKFEAKDKYGFSYSVEKNIEIQALQDVQMSLKDNETIRTFNTWETYIKPTLDFKLRLEQEDRFIYGEKIVVNLYKEGVLQPLNDYSGGGVIITSNYEDSSYVYAYTPEEGHFGTYELVFTYNGLNGQQIIRQTFVVKSKKPFETDVFRFRMSGKNSGRYYEDLNYVYVVLNGERLKADKEMYTLNDSTFPVYTIHKTILVNTYYDFQMEDWWWNGRNRPLYIGKDNDTPTIFYGDIREGSTKIEVKDVNINISKSELKNDSIIYFEGFSTKLALDVEGDWANKDVGYYEVATLKFGEGISRYEDTGFKSILTQAHNNKSKVQTINIRPGIQASLQNKDKSEQYWIRMVSPQGYKSTWEMCPDVFVLPVPRIMGKKLNVSIQDGEYAISWPTVFDGPIGGKISFLDGIPVIDGGNFGLGGGMPKFEAQKGDSVTDIFLSFEAKGGYGEKGKTKQATKYKKVKKVSIVGYEFEMELTGGINIYYNWIVDEWNIDKMYIIIDGSGGKYWDKGYEFLGVGFTAGVGIGADVFGLLQIKNGDEIDYSGIVRITPNANLHVDGNFAIASVKGSLSAKIPAEIHFPTGYIGADITVDANIHGKALLWSKTLYEKNLLKLHWDNGKKRVTLLQNENSLEETLIEKGSGVELMSRDYLRRESIWQGGNTSFEETEDNSILRKLSIMETTTNPKIENIIENIFPEAETALFVNDNQQYLIWTDDNPLRDALNRTQLRFTYFKDGVWSVPEWICDDDTADFAPSVVAMENGFLMAWQNISKALTEGEGLAEMLESTEISVTENVYTDGSNSPHIINLTNDDKIDHSPKLVANGDRALLVWTKSEKMSFDFDGEESTSLLPGDKLFFSQWSNGVWADPHAIEMDTEYSTILDVNLVMKGEEALLLYTQDMDNNLSTGDDREVFAKIYDGSMWRDTIRLTDNGVNDSSPKAVNVDEKWFITWLEEGKVSYKTGLNGEIRTEECLGNIQSNYQIAITDGDRPLVAIIYTQPGENKALGISTSFYDFDNGKWSDKINILTKDIYANAISASFDSEGKLNIAFTEADIITEAKSQIIDDVEELIEFASVSDKVSLKLLTYTTMHDLSLLENESMALSTEFPVPNTVTMVYITVGNSGDFAENAIVTLYDGNPEEGGVKIAETAPQLISAQSSIEMEVEWLVGSEERYEYDLYAVVRSNDGIQEINTANNTANIKVFTSDIVITDLTCKNQVADDYLINVTILNRGSRILHGAKIWLEDEFNGEILMTANVGTLELGEETVLTYVITSNGRKNMLMKVALPDEVNEENTDNNTWGFSLEPLSFVVKSLNIAPGDEQIDLASDISFDFNINIGQGQGFEQIRLIDELLNDVVINKTIENSKLTIKPLQLMEHDTKYQLIIPTNALGDSYGHTLKEAIKLGFTTATTNPEIISAYPGEFMENTAIDTKLRLKFNQNIIKGYEYSNIALLEYVDGLEVKIVPIVGTIEGELLSMNYTGNLCKNATYTLKIPRGAVENNSGETLREDYLLAFNTGETAESNVPNEPEHRPSLNTSAEYKANISVDGTEKSVVVRVKAGKAVIKLGDMAREIFMDNQQVVLDISHITGVNSYTFEMPAETLAQSGKALFNVNTALGSILIPSNMLSTMNKTLGKTAGITIEALDRSKLPADVKEAIGNRPVLELTLTLDNMVTKWNNPDTSVMISIPYTPTSEELRNLESIVIWYVDGNGNVVTVTNGRYNVLTGRVNFVTNHFSTFAVMYNKVSFKDVPDSAWYYEAVNFIAAREITLGTGNGNFSPNNKLTRGEFLTIMMKAYGIEQNTEAEDSFSDAGNTWYTGYLTAAKHLGITKGTGDNMFKPNSEITRQEMFTLLYNTLKLIGQLPIGESDKSLIDFDDSDEITPWAEDAMTFFIQTGIIKGDSGKLKPEDTGSRAQMSQVIYNLLIK